MIAASGWHCSCLNSTTVVLPSEFLCDFLSLLENLAMCSDDLTWQAPLARGVWILQTVIRCRKARSPVWNGLASSLRCFEYRMFLHVYRFYTICISNDISEWFNHRICAIFCKYNIFYVTISKTELDSQLERCHLEIYLCYLSLNFPLPQQLSTQDQFLGKAVRVILSRLSFKDLSSFIR